MMKKYCTLFNSLLLTLSLFGLFTKSVVAEISIKSLNNYKITEALENIKVVKLSTDKNSSNFLILIKKSVSAHRHLSHTESIYVISGKGIFTLGSESVKISAGDFIHVPEGTIHAVEVTSEMPLKVLSNQAPEFFGKDRIYVK